jgi:hypothetical protein
MRSSCFSLVFVFRRPTPACPDLLGKRNLSDGATHAGAAALVANLKEAPRSTRSCGYQMLTQSSGRSTGTRTCHCCSPALASTNRFRPSTGKSSGYLISNCQSLCS